jgi:hypothetical protein
MLTENESLQPLLNPSQSNKIILDKNTLHSNSAQNNSPQNSNNDNKKYFKKLEIDQNEIIIWYKTTIILPLNNNKEVQTFMQKHFNNNDIILNDLTKLQQMQFELYKIFKDDLYKHEVKNDEIVKNNFNFTIADINLVDRITFNKLINELIKSINELHTAENVKTSTKTYKYIDISLQNLKTVSINNLAIDGYMKSLKYLNNICKYIKKYFNNNDNVINYIAKCLNFIKKALFNYLLILNDYSEDNNVLPLNEFDIPIPIKQINMPDNSTVTLGNNGLIKVKNSSSTQPILINNSNNNRSLIQKFKNKIHTKIVASTLKYKCFQKENPLLTNDVNLQKFIQILFKLNHNETFDSNFNIEYYILQIKNIDLIYKYNPIQELNFKVKCAHLNLIKYSQINNSAKWSNMTSSLNNIYYTTQTIKTIKHILKYYKYLIDLYKYLFPELKRLHVLSKKVTNFTRTHIINPSKSKYNAAVTRVSPYFKGTKGKFSEAKQHVTKFLSRFGLGKKVTPITTKYTRVLRAPGKSNINNGSNNGIVA